MPRKKLSSISPDGRYALNWGSDGIVRIVDLRSMEEIWWLWDNYPVWILRAAFSHDMRRILCYNWGGTVAVWSAPRAHGSSKAENIVEAIQHEKERFCVRNALLPNHQYL